MTIETVLVVDDSSTQLHSIQNIITEAGYQVLTAKSGFEAIEFAKQHHPDLIFLDIMMPGMDGFEACRKLSMERSTQEIPVVFVSSKDQKSDRVWASMQGGKAYIVKPYDKNQIIAQIEAFQ